MANYIYTGSWKSSPEKDDAGIQLYRQNPQNGTLDAVEKYMPELSAGYICISENGKYLYTVDEIKRHPDHMETEGSIWAFKIDRRDGTLKEINHISSYGVFPNYLAVSKDGRHLFAVNYGSEDVLIRTKRNHKGEIEIEHLYEESSMAAFSLREDGGLDQLEDLRKAEGIPSRFFEWFQSAPHPHCIGISPDDQMILVADRGCDKIIVCGYDRAERKYSDIHEYPVSRGIGPRNCIFHPNGNMVYVLGEVQPYVIAYQYDSKTRMMVEKQRCLTADEEEIYDGKEKSFFLCAHPSDIQIHPDGTMLYVLNRGPDTIACFEILKDGTLRCKGRIASKGVWPWSCTIDEQGNYMYIVHKNSNSVSIFRLDKEGIPVYTGFKTDLDNGVCIKSTAVGPE